MMRSIPGRRFELVVLLPLCLALASLARADEGRPFPGPRITPQQWAALYDQVKARPGARDISRPDVPGIVAIAVPEESKVTVYYFTTSGPEHPAVVIQEWLPGEGRLKVRYSGYFAGSEMAFSRWFKSITQRGQAVHDALQPPQVLCSEDKTQPCP